MPEMSWLSPKRRRTTGNLKTLPNGDHPNDGPPANQPKATTPRSERAPSLPKTPRPVSQPYASSPSSASDGNLFYAYARRGDDLKSRYLLTFASASTANEWWLLIQANFPDCTRPGPQLFSFRTEELLSKAWKHAAFEHLKTKWMYISFSESSSSGVGGAAQGIIPVQDERGNMLGGSSSPDPTLLGQVKKETKSVKNELSRMDEHFEKMMEAVERNTNSVSRLAQERQRAGEGVRPGEGGGYFDTTELSHHFGPLTDLLQRHTESVESMSKKQLENEQKLRSALEDVSAKQRADYLDMAQLSAHLDRIQGMMEASIKDRKDSAKELAEQQQLPPRPVNFSPLTSRLEKMQEAVEQNSGLIKALLDEGAPPDSKPGTPFWGREPQPPVDLSPLTEHLQNIHSAIEQQSSHLQALVGFASGPDDSGIGLESGTPRPPAVSLSPLGEHLEQIYNSIEEGNKHAREVAKRKNSMSGPDLKPLMKHLGSISAKSDNNAEIFQQMLESQRAAQAALEESKAPEIDLTPLTKQMEAIHVSSKQLLTAQQATRSAIEKNKTPAPNFAPLKKQLEVMHESTKDHFDLFRQFFHSQKATTTAVEQNGSKIDFTLLINHLEILHTDSKEHTDLLQRLLDSQEATKQAVELNGRELDLTPLAEQMQAVRAAIEDNGNSSAAGLAPVTEHLEAMRTSSNNHESLMQEMIEAQQSTKEAVGSSTSQPDLTPLTGHLEAIRTATDQNSQHIKSLVKLHSEGTTNGIDFTPLTAHLDSIRTAIEDNSEIDFTPLADHFDAMRTATEENSTHLHALLTTQESRASEIDLTPLTERLNRIHASLEKSHTPKRRESSPGTGDAKFIMSALTSHLSKIQAVTENNAVAVKGLRERQAAGQERMAAAVAETSEHLRTLATRQNEIAAQQQEQAALPSVSFSSSEARALEQRMEATNSQVRELMAGQREMVKVMRELAQSLAAQNGSACGHVVIPPPRKVGRKIVGFVYDAKDGLV